MSTWWLVVSDDDHHELISVRSGLLIFFVNHTYITSVGWTHTRKITHPSLAWGMHWLYFHRIFKALINIKWMRDSPCMMQHTRMPLSLSLSLYLKADKCYLRNARNTEQRNRRLTDPSNVEIPRRSTKAWLMATWFRLTLIGAPITERPSRICYLTLLTYVGIIWGHGWSNCLEKKTIEVGAASQRQITHEVTVVICL